MRYDREWERILSGIFLHGVEECVSVRRGFMGKFVFLYVEMHILIYEGRNATSSNALINVFTFI